MLSMYSNLAKQYVLSTNLFHSFALFLKFGITDVTVQPWICSLALDPMVSPLQHHLLECKFHY